MKKVGSSEGLPSAGEHASPRDPIAVLIFSYLLWESTTKQADDAMRKVMGAIVDFNELRVSLPNEIAGLIGARYPLAIERAQRLKLSLQSIYLDQHAVSLDHLAEKGKRESKAFMEGLEGIPPYVSARVLQRCFGVHLIPVDDRLVDLMVDAKVFSEVVDSAEASSWLSRQVKSQEGDSVSDALRCFVDKAPKPAKRSTPRPKLVLYAAIPSEGDPTDGDSPAASDAPSTATSSPASATNTDEARKGASKSESRTATRKAASASAKKVAKKSVAKKAAKKTTKKTTKKVAKKAPKKAPKKVTKKAVKKAAKKAAKKTAKKATKKATKKAAKKAAKKTTKKAARKTAKKVAKKTLGKTTRKAAKKKASRKAVRKTRR